MVELRNLCWIDLISYAFVNRHKSAAECFHSKGDSHLMMHTKPQMLKMATKQ